MVVFTAGDWISSLILFAIFLIFVLGPCGFITYLGHKMITQIGLKPSQASVIQMRYALPLFAVECIGFLSLFVYYQVLSGS